MDLLTIRLDDLGQDCIVKNDKGEVFVQLSKTKAAFNTTTNKWELSFVSKRNGRVSTKGNAQLSISAPQSQQEREAGVKQTWYGNGIVLFEDNLERTPSYDSKPAWNGKKTGTSLPKADLPM
jgi:hypothetical protein